MTTTTEKTTSSNAFEQMFGALLREIQIDLPIKHLLTAKLLTE